MLDPGGLGRRMMDCPLPLGGFAEKGPESFMTLLFAVVAGPGRGEVGGWGGVNRRLG